MDNTAPKEIQASAQGLITLVTYGFGMLIGSWSSGWFLDYYTLSEAHLWKSVRLIPAIMALVAALALLFFFKDVELKKEES